MSIYLKSSTLSLSTLEIVKLIQPFTDTAVCLADRQTLAQTVLPRMYFLKIYDQRHANAERSPWTSGLGPWTGAREPSYHPYPANPVPSTKHLRGEFWFEVITSREHQIKRRKRKAM